MATKKICIQIRPDREVSLDVKIIESSLLEIDIQSKVSEGNDNGRYINYIIETNNLVLAWTSIKFKLIGNSLIANTAIITCEGNYGWDDYLLLHHYDKKEIIDDLQNH